MTLLLLSVSNKNQKSQLSLTLVSESRKEDKINQEFSQPTCNTDRCKSESITLVFDNITIIFKNFNKFQKLKLFNNQMQAVNQL